MAIDECLLLRARLVAILAKFFGWPKLFNVLFSLPQNSKFFHPLSIISIFNRLYGVLNVGKKITNYTV
jgi:hypothetical protein